MKIRTKEICYCETCAKPGKTFYKNSIGAYVCSKCLKTEEPHENQEDLKKALVSRKTIPGKQWVCLTKSNLKRIQKFMEENDMTCVILSGRWDEDAQQFFTTATCEIK